MKQFAALFAIFFAVSIQMYPASANPDRLDGSTQHAAQIEELGNSHSTDKAEDDISDEEFVKQTRSQQAFDAEQRKARAENKDRTLPNMKVWWPF